MKKTSKKNMYGEYARSVGRYRKPMDDRTSNGNREDSAIAELPLVSDGGSRSFTIYSASRVDELPMDVEPPAVGATAQGTYVWLENDETWRGPLTADHAQEQLHDGTRVEPVSRVHRVSRYAGGDIGERTNAAIVALPPEGGRVVLPSGTHTLTTTITDQGTDNVVLEGQGQNTQILLEEDTTANMIELEDVSGWTIRQLFLHGNGRNQIDGEDRGVQCGIYCVGTEDLLIEDNYIYDTRYANIRLQGSTPIRNAIVRGNVCDTTRGEGDVAHDSISLTAHADGVIRDWIVANNLCLNNGHQSIEIATSSRGGIVAGNVIRDADQTGIDIHGPNSTNIVCANNFIQNVSTDVDIAGITLRADGSVAVGNVIESADADGIALSNPRCNAIGNTINASSGRGVYTTTEEATSLTIANNTISAAKHGVELQSSDCTVIGNTITDSRETGVNLLAGGNFVAVNQIDRSGTWAVACESSDNYVFGNYVQDSSEGGILVTPGQERNALVGNYLRDIESIGISIGRDGGEPPVDTRLENNVTYIDGQQVKDRGSRTTVDNVGVNNGDPQVEGEWHNHGSTGVHVYDVENEELYHRVPGGWA